jgi:hypothetical protein
VFWYKIAEFLQDFCPRSTRRLVGEFERAEKSGKDSDAINEVLRVAASVLWLYQRKKLKDELHSSDLSDLRHYFIVISSMHFGIFVARFDGAEYLVQAIATGSLMQLEGVQRYATVSGANQFTIGVWDLMQDRLRKTSRPY